MITAFHTPGAICAGTLAVARSAAPGGRGAPLPTIVCHGAIQERIDDGGAGGSLLPVTC